MIGKNQMFWKNLYIFVRVFILSVCFTQPLLAGVLTGERGIAVNAIDSETGMEQQVDLYQKMHAVIIGIDEYKDSEITQLSYAVKDAKGIEDILRKRYRFDNIYTLYNASATRLEIMKLLEGTLSTINDQDAVFVFFAGHGTTLEIKSSDDNKEKLDYIIPYDGSFKKNEMYLNISMSQLKNDVGRIIPAKHIFFVLDSCYSGALLAEVRAAEGIPKDEYAYLSDATSMMTRQAFTAGTEGQTVLDGGYKGHSIFTGQLIEKLEKANGYITAKRLGLSITGAVKSAAKEYGHVQTPRLGKLSGDYGGDFVFVPKTKKYVLIGETKEVNVKIFPENSFTSGLKSSLSMAASLNRKYVAIGNINGVELWDISTMQLAKKIKRRTTSLQFSPDSTKLAMGGYQELSILDIKTEQAYNFSTSHTNYIVSLAFNPDGSILASGSKGDDQTIELLKITSGNVIKILKRKHNKAEDIKVLRFSPDGRLLASASLDGDEAIKIWQVESGQLWKTLNFMDNDEISGEIVTSFMFSPDAKLLVAGLSRGSIVMYNIEFNLTDIFKIHVDAVTGLDFTPDSQFIISGSRDNMIKFSDLKTKTLLHATQLDGSYNLLTVLPKTQMIKRGTIITSGSKKTSIYSLPELREVNVSTTMLDK